MKKEEAEERKAETEPVEKLYSELSEILEEIKGDGFEVLGNLELEVVEKIDNKKRRIAKLEGNKILIKTNTIILPKKVLKYILAHEIAHIFTKKHTKKFWEIVEAIQPDYKEAQALLIEYSKDL